jgi:large repetitive protein
MIQVNFSGELADLAKSIGLLSPQGELDTSWFSDPFGRLSTVLSNAEQRAALLRLLDSALPPKAGSDVPASEKWHPLLTANEFGNIYVTVRNDSDAAVIGLAGDFGRDPILPAPTRPLSASISASMPIIRAGATVTPLPGSNDGPLIIRLRVGVNLQRAPGAPGIALSAVGVEARVRPSGFQLYIVLEGLSLSEGEAPADKVLDPAELGNEVPNLVAGLLKHIVSQDPVAAGMVSDAVGLLGLGDSAIRPFPFAELANNPAAIQQWLSDLFEGAAPPIRSWLQHFTGLFRSLFGALPAATPEPGVNAWGIDIIPFGANAALRILVALRNNVFRVGFAARASVVLDGKRASIEGGVAIADIPISGADRAKLLPEAYARLRLTGAGGAAGDDFIGLVAGFRVGAINAGIGWDGTNVLPLLELADVRFNGDLYARLDLTNTDSVEAAARNVVVNAIDAALGGGTVARRIAALAGLAPPRNPADATQPLAGWPHALDTARLVSDPLGAFAAYHRAVLVHPAFGWNFLFREIVELLPGVSVTVTGSGTPDDPWRIALGAPLGPLALELVAWNAQTSGVAGDDQQLRLGLRLVAASAPFLFTWLAELLAFDLPAAGSGRVAIVGTQRVSVRVEPAFSGPLLGGLAGSNLTASVQSANVRVDWTPGSAVMWRASLDNIRLQAGADVVAVPAIVFPPPAGFDLANPAAAAAVFGLTPTTLERLLLLLAAQATNALGPQTVRLTSMLGIHRQQAGLPADWPTWSDPAASGRMLTDPLGALRGWLARVVTSASADGVPHVQRWIEQLRTMLLDRDDAELMRRVTGAGTYDEPWTLPAPMPGNPGASIAQFQVWIGPDGPPNAMYAGLEVLAQAAPQADALLSVLQRVAEFDPGLRARLRGRSRDGLLTGIELLADLLERSDGVVPLASQQPQLAGWTHAAPIEAEHWALPTQANAINLVGAKVDEWAGGVAAPRVVLLLAPAYARQLAAAEIWTQLLASPNARGAKDAAARFELADASIPDPLTYPLETVSAVADWYVAELPDDDLPDWPRHAQLIGRIVDRLSVLRPGVSVTLVAHSTAGIAAREYAVANPVRVVGLITLATPHVGANLPFLTDPDLADAIRVGGRLVSQFAAGSARAAIERLLLAIDGYVAPPVGEIPQARHFPFSAFDTSQATLEIGGLQIFTIGARASAGPLLAQVKTATRTLVQGIAAAPRAAPAYLAVGVSVPLNLPPPTPGEINAEVRAHFELLRIGLNAASAPRLGGTARFSARLYRQGGWLLGSPSTVPLTQEITDPRTAFEDVRLRELEFGLDVSFSGAAVPAITNPWVRLYDAALHGPTVPFSGAADAFGFGVIGALLRTFSSDTVPATGSAGSLVGALSAIGIMQRDASAVLGLSQDAWTALENDAAGFLASRVPAALDLPGGWLGFSGSNGNWIWNPGGTLAISLERDGTRGPWSVHLRSGAEAEASGLRFAVDARVALPSFAADVDFTLGIGALSATFRTAAGVESLVVNASPWAEQLQLLPAPSAAAFTASLSALWPKMLFSGALSLGLNAVAPGLRLAAVERFFQDTGGELLKAFTSLTGGLSIERVRALINAVARAAGLSPDDGITLPGGLRLTVEAEPPLAGANPPGPSALRFTLATTSDIGGALALRAGVRLDTTLHATPHAEITLAHDIDGGWGRLGLHFGIDARGVALAVIPNNSQPIELLPTFSGLGALRGAAAALLPAVLDQVVAATVAPRPVWLQRILDLAQALDLYDAAGGFAAKTDRLRALLDANMSGFFTPATRDAIAQSLVDTVASLTGLPLTVSRSGSVARLGFTPPGGLTGTVGLVVGFDLGAPKVGLFADNLTIAGVLSASLNASGGPAGFTCDGRLAVRLERVQILLAPRIDFQAQTGAGGGVMLRMLPVATGLDDTMSGPLIIQVAPTFSVQTPAGSVEVLITQWLLPLVANTLLRFAQTEGLLAKKLWSTGPTVQEVLVGSQLVSSAAPATLRTPLPQVWPMIAGAIEVIANAVEIPIGDLKLYFVSDPSPTASPRRLGVGLRGQQAFEVGDITIAVLLGAPESWEQTVGGDAGTPGAADGLQVFVLKLGLPNPELEVSVKLSGVGIGVYGADGKPLVDDPSVRIGGIGGYFFGDIDTQPSLQASRLGGGLQIRDFGLPLGGLTNGAGGGSNPVVGALMGGSGSGGDEQAPTPGVDVEVWYREDDRLHVRMSGGSGVLWIGVHSQFGPIYIDQVGVRLTSEEAGLIVDGGVSISGFSAQVDDLSLTVPYRNPGNVSLDLKGLGLGFSSGGISIAGGLVKFDNPIEYDGMLLIKISDFGAVAVGSYAVPEQAGGERYTSLAIFGGIFVTFGYAPIIVFKAIGIGIGLNRRLLVPEDINEIPRFMLVQALDQPEQLANDPLGALLRFRDAVPPKRGAFWLAIGLKGCAFQIVNLTAVVYVALDSGVEIGLLGVARVALPPSDTALICVELALKARFSTAEMLLSIQAQLTDNSWLISEDCQLTGGFAFFMWFRESQFLLTLGGYHPGFQKRPEYPTVPRLGFRWNLFEVVQIKGENYFALTNTCVMAGLRLELVYGPDWLQLWFTAHADFLAEWDPFKFQGDVGIAVGARLRIEACFIVCVHVEISISVGAELHIEGPPLHGTVTVDLGVTSVTVPFGEQVQPVAPTLSWDAFVRKYLQSDSDETLPVGVQVSRGMLTPDPPGGEVAPGTASQPWKLAPEWSFMTETRMPVRAITFVDDANLRNWSANPVSPFARFNVSAQTYDLDIAPMKKENVEATHRVFIERLQGGAWLRFAAGDLDRDRFRVEPRFGQVSQATYELFSGTPPAAANTLPAALGLVINGNCELRSNTPDIVPIAKLRDATNPRPLPFAQPDDPLWVEVRIAGRAAERYLELGEKFEHVQVLTAAHNILSGSDTVFAENRVTSGVRKRGLGSVGGHALLTQRSAAPLIAPLSTGLSMKPVERKILADALRPALVRPVQLAAPRLRAVMQSRLAATEQQAVTLRTTVTLSKRDAAVPRIDARRDLRREVKLTGAQLRFAPRVGAPSPTRFPNTSRSLRSPQVGASVGRRHRQQFYQLEKLVNSEGALLRAGVSQVWDVPRGGYQLQLDGDQAVRVTLLSRGGSVLEDREYGSARDLSIVLPENAAAVAISGLGQLMANGEGWKVPPSVGAVTAFAAPAGRYAATGWQSSDQVLQVGDTTLLARGSVLRLSDRALSRRTGEKSPHGVLTMSVAAEAGSIETTLPAATRVVAITLDARIARLPNDADLELVVRGAKLASDPVRAGSGLRAIYLFDVIAEPQKEKDPPALEIGVVTSDDVRLTGVVGLGGTALAWGERLNGTVPDDWVPDGPLTAGGQTRIRLRKR